MLENLPPLWAHQKEAVIRARDVPWFALHFEPGTGKSRTVLEIIRENINLSKRFKRVLILCPAIVRVNWVEEILRYTAIPKDKAIVLDGSQTQRLKTFMKYGFNEDGTPKALIFITNYEAVEMKDLYAAMKKWAAEILIQDEAHRLKNPQSKRSKLVEELANNKKSPPEKRYQLTGTAVLNSPLDLFMQFKVLMGGFPLEDYFVSRDVRHLCTNFYQFRALFFKDANAGFRSSEHYFPNWVPKEDTNSKISQILRSYSLSVKKSDCLDLPPEQDIIVDVGLSKKQATDYLSMQDHGVVLAGGQAFTADLALTQTMRLMQICSGFLSTNGGWSTETESQNPPIKHLYEENARDEKLEDLLDTICVQAGKKVLVWAVWKQNYESIKKVCEKLGLKYVEVNGSVSGEEKERARKSFINDPSISVWIGHPNAGGIGVNLIVAPYTIWYSRGYSLEQYEQAKARNYRGGQTEAVTHYHLVAKGTIEEEVLTSLREKQSMAEKIAAFTRYIGGFKK